jgi:hypothetical protein
MGSLGNNQALVFHHFQDNNIFGMKLFALMLLVAAVTSFFVKNVHLPEELARVYGTCL